ncbi:Mob1/phocein [Phlyctochytrium arcticum]|nr:Mob1/phocein [Phlyctochytrium arcticum]
MGKQRRNRPGIRHEVSGRRLDKLLRKLTHGSHKDWSSWDSVPLDKLDSTFAIQEYLQSVLRINPAALALFCPSPENQDADLWRYELLRQTCLELNGLVIALESDCTAETCPQMKALDWLYLCAGHVQPQQCTALDYTVHTLDAAIAQLNNQKSFPSRVSIPRNSLKHLTSITRRLYRIFAHAWFHHREIFIEFEAESHLYARFLHMIKTYNVRQFVVFERL